MEAITGLSIFGDSCMLAKLNTTMIVVMLTAGAGHAADYFVPGNFDTIQDAIDFAQDGDAVLVAPGVFRESIDFKGKAIRVEAVFGTGSTTINATGLQDSAVLCRTNEGPGTVLKGFTITGGSGNPSLFGDPLGGGMFNFTSDPTVIDCVFTGNTSDGGGGMANIGSDPTIIGCKFLDNYAGFEAGGGGMTNISSDPFVANCLFSGNTSNLDGGAVANLSGRPVFVNCVFADNEAALGGGVKSTGSTVIINNCTFSRNLADFGGAIRNSSGGTVAISNCIMWDNFPDEIQTLAGTETVVSFSTIAGGWTGPGVGNSTDDPMFVDASAGNLRLQESSPAIDVGDRHSYVGPGVDLDGKPRMYRRADVTALIPGGPDKQSAKIDHGAYEYQPDVADP